MQARRYVRAIRAVREAAAVRIQSRVRGARVRSGWQASGRACAKENQPPQPPLHDPLAAAKAVREGDGPPLDPWEVPAKAHQQSFGEREPLHDHPAPVLTDSTLHLQSVGSGTPSTKLCASPREDEAEREAREARRNAQALEHEMQMDAVQAQFDALREYRIRLLQELSAKPVTPQPALSGTGRPRPSVSALWRSPSGTCGRSAARLPLVGRGHPLALLAPGSAPPPATAPQAGRPAPPAAAAAGRLASSPSPSPVRTATAVPSDCSSRPEWPSAPSSARGERGRGAQPVLSELVGAFGSPTADAPALAPLQQARAPATPGASPRTPGAVGKPTASPRLGAPRPGSKHDSLLQDLLSKCGNISNMQTRILCQEFRMESEAARQAFCDGSVPHKRPTPSPRRSAEAPTPSPRTRGVRELTPRGMQPCSSKQRFCGPPTAARASSATPCPGAASTPLLVPPSWRRGAAAMAGPPPGARSSEVRIGPGAAARGASQGRSAGKRVEPQPATRPRVSALVRSPWEVPAVAGTRHP